MSRLFKLTERDGSLSYTHLRTILDSLVSYCDMLTGGEQVDQNLIIQGEYRMF